MTDRDANGRFIAGNCANPNGRPKKEREERYRSILLNTISFQDWARIIEKARDQALKGDAVARKWLADYIIGPPVQRNEHTGADGGAIVFVDETHRDSITSITSNPANGE